MANSEDVVCLKHRSGKSQCQVHLYGATVISWICEDEEMLFVSSKSLFDNKKAIRGGIPLVFPCFGPWEHGPQHGFARINRWKVADQPSQDESGDVSAVFSLKDDEVIRKTWNHKFRLEYKVKLTSRTLDTSFAVHNTGEDTFDFTCLLHTYFRVPDVTKCTVSGLAGLKYVDKVQGGETFTEKRELVTVAENVDRVYQSTPSDHVVTAAGGDRTVNLMKTNLPDTVVWNPWVEKAAAMADFGDAEYPSMLCVEAGHVTTPVVLEAQKSFMSSQTITARL